MTIQTNHMLNTIFHAANNSPATLPDRYRRPTREADVGRINKLLDDG